MNFPYDIPNIQAGGPTPTNNFVLTNLDSAAGLDVELTSAFYSGLELENAINLEIGQLAVDAGVPANDLPVFSFQDTENLMVITPPAAPTAPQAWVITSAYTFPVPNFPGLIPSNNLGKDIMSLMGFLPSQGNTLYLLGPAIPNSNGLYIVNTNYAGPSTIPATAKTGVISGASSAPLSFTQYIDICSPELCQYQYFRDGSTTNLARRADVICRLYISNNVATQETEGQRPFVINRQFNNARVMRWNSGSSIGSMSVQLFDDVGQPLTTTWQPRPYQISFNVYEQDKDSTTY